MYIHIYNFIFFKIIFVKNILNMIFFFYKILERISYYKRTDYIQLISI